MNYQPLIERWTGGDLDRWARLLPEQLAKGLSHQRYGDLARWIEVLDALPDYQPDFIHLDTSRVGAGNEQALPAEDRAALKQTLLGLHPWRKGPFELFGVHIDTEWRSDWKWDRLQNHIAPLQGKPISKSPKIQMATVFNSSKSCSVAWEVLAI